MKNFLILLLFVTTASTAHAQQGTIIISNKGMAPVPSFGNADPVAFISHATKFSKHFELTPDVAFSLKTGNLWFTDMWWRGNFFLDSAQKWLFTVGIDFPSYFGQTYSNNGNKIDQIVLYYTGQLRMKYTAHKNATIIFDYWYTKAMKMDLGVKGHYASLALEWSKQLNSKLAIGSNPNFFYLNFSDNTRGFAASTNLSLFHLKSGLFLSTQGLIPINVSNVRATANVSLGISRKLY